MLWEFKTVMKTLYRMTFSSRLYLFPFLYHLYIFCIRFTDVCVQGHFGTRSLLHNIPFVLAWSPGLFVASDVRGAAKKYPRNGFFTFLSSRLEFHSEILPSRPVHTWRSYQHVIRLLCLKSSAFLWCHLVIFAAPCTWLRLHILSSECFFVLVFCSLK